jgi:hypothetical protein
MSDENGKDVRRQNQRFSFDIPDWDALGRQTKWELAGSILLLIVALSMAAAVRLYAP